jgi:hypothetical protein
VSVADKDFSLHHSSVESRQFNRSIFRATFAAMDAALLSDLMQRNQIDTLIARVPPRALSQVADLYSCGLQPIVAEALVHYDIRLADFAEGGASPALQFTPVDNSNRLREMARTIFQDYPSHYRSNPLLDASLIADGYADWAVRLSEGADTTARFFGRGGVIAGFVAYRINPGEQAATFLLAGVLPQMRGDGVYLQMFSEMLGGFKADGLRIAETATQAHNVASQRTWTKLGMALRSVEYTLHVNRR